MERLDEWKELIIEGGEYVDSGDPLKDVLDDCDIADIISILATILKEK